MSNFENMTTQELLEIINFKHENTFTHDEVQEARAIYLSRISLKNKAEEEIYENKLNKSEESNEKKVNADEAAETENLITEASADVSEIINENPISDSNDEDKEDLDYTEYEDYTEYHDTSDFAHRTVFTAGILTFCISAFLIFLVSVTAVILNYKPILNFYILGALIVLLIAIFAWYYFVNGKSVGTVLCRALALSQLIYVNPLSLKAIVLTIFLVLFIISIEKTKKYNKNKITSCT